MVRTLLYSSNKIKHNIITSRVHHFNMVIINLRFGHENSIFSVFKQFHSGCVHCTHWLVFFATIRWFRCCFFFFSAFVRTIINHHIFERTKTEMLRSVQGEFQLCAWKRTNAKNVEIIGQHNSMIFIHWIMTKNMDATLRTVSFTMTNVFFAQFIRCKRYAALQNYAAADQTDE